jgi:membrane-associated protease RseP (regulator of RpoE activity)
MEERPLDNDIQLVLRLLADLYGADAIYRQGDRVALSLTARYDPKRSRKLLHDRLRIAGYQFSLTDSPDGPLVLSIDPRRRFHIPLLNVGLFLATIVTIYLVPVFWRAGLDLQLTLQYLREGIGLEFTLALVSILLVHEMGHFVASRRRGIVTTWPYFIPAPNLFGTFGAVIASKSPFWNRRDLLEVGASGPIAGWVVALIWLGIGLASTHIVSAPQQIMDWSLEGESIIMTVLTKWLVGTAPEGAAYRLSEFALAGWAGLLVTALNMLPIGQLDGGHILYGLLWRKQRWFGWGAAIALLGLGFLSPMWWLLGGLGILMGVAHPPTLQDERPPTRTAGIMGIIALIILVLSFAPVPFRG